MERKPLTFRRNAGQYQRRELVHTPGGEAAYKVTTYPNRHAWRIQIRREKAEGKGKS